LKVRGFGKRGTGKNGFIGFGKKNEFKAGTGVRGGVLKPDVERRWQWVALWIKRDCGS